MSESVERRPIRHFTDLDVWRRSHTLFLDVFRDFENTGTRSRLASEVVARQVLRSTSSIGANIAEGFASSSTREYIRFLEIARRSCAETENWYYKARDASLCTAETSRERIKDCLDVHKMLNALITSLRRRKKRAMGEKSAKAE